MPSISRRERLRRSLEQPTEPGLLCRDSAVETQLPTIDPAEWRMPFVKWLDSVCVLGPRYFGSVGRLHIDFCEWESKRGGVACARGTFERLLEESGFRIDEIAAVVIVSGMMFRGDLWAQERFQTADNTSIQGHPPGSTVSD